MLHPTAPPDLLEEIAMQNIIDEVKYNIVGNTLLLTTTLDEGGPRKALEIEAAYKASAANWSYCKISRAQVGQSDPVKFIINMKELIVDAIKSLKTAGFRFLRHPEINNNRKTKINWCYGAHIDCTIKQSPKIVFVNLVRPNSIDSLTVTACLK